MIQVCEWKVTSNYPTNFEIICILNLWIGVSHKEVRLVVRIRFSFHDSETLEAPTFIYRKYENHMIGSVEGLGQLSCRARCGRPNIVLNWKFDIVHGKTFNNEKSCSPSQNVLSICYFLCDIHFERFASYSFNKENLLRDIIEFLDYSKKCEVVNCSAIELKNSKI